MAPRPPTEIPSLDRRRFLSLGSAAACAAIAGCLGSGDAPGYERWIPATDDDFVTAYLDLSVTEVSDSAQRLLPVILPSGDDGSGQSLSSIRGLDAVDDPLVTTPLRIGGNVLGVAALSIAATGLGPLLFQGGTFGRLDEIFLVEGVVGVSVGDVEMSAVREHLEDGSDDAFGAIAFERIDEGAEYAFYEPVQEDRDGVAAVGDAYVLLADTQAELRTVIDTRQGDHERASDADDTVDWLFETAGEGHFMVGWDGTFQVDEFYFGDPAEDLAGHPLIRRETVLSSVSFVPDTGEMEANLALADGDLDAASRDRLASRLGTAGEDTSFTGEAGRVEATGTYTEDVLDIEYTTETEPTERPPPEERYEGVGETPAAVESAVPDQAFAFVNEADEGLAQVRFLEEFEAEEVTVISLERGGQVSTTTPETTNYLSVPVEDDGDEVVVLATVDGETGEVARTHIVGD